MLAYSIYAAHFLAKVFRFHLFSIYVFNLVSFTGLCQHFHCYHSASLVSKCFLKQLYNTVKSLKYL